MVPPFRSACLSLSFLLAHFSWAFGQDRLQIHAGCAFEAAVFNTNPYVFPPSEEAAEIVAKICRQVGVPQRFELRQANVANALATVSNGRRVIMYNPVFLENFKSDARTRWAVYAVLAHEIGHHLSGHTFDESDPAARKKYELEADKFAGSAMRSLGATFDEAQAGVKNIKTEAETADYPPKSARIASVAAGWKEKDEQLKKLGATGLGDGSGTTLQRDTDRDGIPDSSDACPDQWGPETTVGCPDSDFDGIADAADKCPYLPGPTRWQGCPDTDGDGLPDHEDDCPRDPGEASDRGCPPADRDADGLPDRSDRCPDVHGLARYRGCPDTDGDGVPDPDDKCPTEKGDPVYEGCNRKTPAATPPTKPDTRPEDPMGCIFVQGGTFQMGCTNEPQDCDDDEKPVHSVTLADFYIGKYEVTQKQWRDIMGSNPSYFKNCDNCPVENVSWDDVQEFLKKLNAKYPGKNYRLPTEAEWEYAARGGQQSKGHQYAGSDNLGLVAWYNGNSGNKTHPVGERKANELGLYDMSGNVWEWCWDLYDPEVYGSYRIFRGGSWAESERGCGAT
ncbi:MAG: SUMF1/EgtB/PvdO family nonheme iron enzyme, partial [Saprospiraceae bacterium]